MPILVADSGSTKCSWRLAGGSRSRTIRTPGMNPYFHTEDEMEHMLRTVLLPALGKVRPDRIFFYGAGCKAPSNASRVKNALLRVFGRIPVEVRHDLAGAARGLCGREKGLVSILGTGSGYCFYDGRVIRRSGTGLGYVLGDEGSGSWLGRILLRHYLYGTLDKPLRQAFESQFPMRAPEILDRIYRQPHPNRFLASFASFLSLNRGNKLVEQIIREGLDAFFQTHLLRDPHCNKYPLHFTGSIAYHFRDQVKSRCKAYGLQTGKIRKDPVDGLVRFHLEA